MMSFFFDGREVAAFATGDKTFGDAFQLFPTLANGGCFLRCDLIVVGGGGNDSKQVGKLLDDFVRRRDQKRGMRFVGFGIENEEATATLANPLDEPLVIRAAQQGFDAVERVGSAAAGAVIRLGPFVNRGKRQAEFGGHLFGAAFLKHLAEQFVRLHSLKMLEAACCWQENIPQDVTFW